MMRESYFWCILALVISLAGLFVSTSGCCAPSLDSRREAASDARSSFSVYRSVVVPPSDATDEERVELDGLADDIDRLLRVLEESEQ